MTDRQFTHSTAKREQVSVLCGLVGPSSSGKTYSALRLATGIAKGSGGGKIFVIDTEAKRALHYADKFAFEHVPFSAPFGPLDYMGALDYCAAQGARVIVVDSMSHEHEGPGGVLEQHAEIVEQKGEKHTFSAWAKPKAQRRALINRILQMQTHFIFCFRAKEKTKPAERGSKELKDLGWCAIAGEEFIYEQTINFLLPPGANGVPNWNPTREGEAAIVKFPEQFRGLNLFADNRQLDEATGEALAKWAAGGEPAKAAPAPETNGHAKPATTNGATKEALRELAEAFKFVDFPADKAERLAFCRKHTGRADLASAADLSPAEVSTVIAALTDNGGSND